MTPHAGARRLALAGPTGAVRAGAALLLKSVLALTFGMVLTMAFAPARAWWLAPYCVAGLFLLLDGRARGGALIGACFGLGWFGAGFWWILPALDSFSAAGMLFSFQLTAALVLYMSLFPACAAVLIVRCRRQARPGWRGRLWTAIQLGLIIAVAEWARGTLFGGFPMLATGYAHADGPLSGYAPVMGVAGLAFLNGTIAALLASACWQSRARQSVLLWLETAGLIAIVIAVGALLQRIDWSTDTGRTLSVSLLQGNLAQAEKFSDAGFAQAVHIYQQMAAAGQGQLTVLPETALPVEWSVLPAAVTQRFQAIADARNSTIVIGSVVYRAGAPDAPGALTNSAMALHPRQAGALPYRYDKQHLVPFAESLPQGSGWIGERLGMGVNGLTPGRPGQAPLLVAGARVALTICFEDLFDTAIAKQAASAEVILNLTNFAWFIGSFAPEQHLQVAQMRAIENARWFIQVSNTGVTALIDAHGNIRQQLPKDQTGMLDGHVRLLTGSTPFSMLGNWPLLLAAALCTLRSVRRPAAR
jgi:apolipoprotein N-acyltransferase